MSEATKEDYAAYRDDSRENYMEVIESLNGRLEHLHYLERIYSRNGATVFNCIRLSLADHNPKTAEDKESLTGIYYLTYSLYDILKEKSQIRILTSLSQLWVEYEFFLSSPTLKRVKLVRAKDLREVVALRPSVETTAFTMPVIVKSNSKVLYQCLQTPHISIDLEYSSVLVSLCQVLATYYKIFLSLDYLKNPDFLKFVTFIDSHIYRLLTGFDKKLLAMSTEKVKEMFKFLNPSCSEVDDPSCF